MKNEMYLRLSNVPSNVSVARIAVATFASSLGFSIPDIEEIKVAVSEAISNAILHAYPGGYGEVSVRASAACDGSLVIEVEDTGQGIADVAKAREPGFTTVPDHMGLGFSFMESFMDEVSVDSWPGRGTKVRMVKKRCS
ncbi:MAG TPA: anti-sigma F factor [Firmicutes bacterium]|nr:anti-sigma F factor [Candidatus Fermentithermobacillaceae bacterium]